MSKIVLKTAAGKSDIFIAGWIEKLGEFVPRDSTLILADENVLIFHKESIKDYPVIPIKSGEASKSLEAYGSLIQQMLDLNVDRTWFLVGLGGGVITDLAGFVASTYFRGLPFGFVSTTLLGQVDAAIGGKNAINYKGYKNILGVIRQPEFVVCDISLLKTLPRREFIGGFAEIIKYAFIRRKDLYPYLVENISSAIEFHDDILQHLVRESVKTKVEIVAKDEFESGDRKLLNFGHTFGHALEKLYGIPHGEAVSVGMMMAAKASTNLGMLQKDVPRKLEDLLVAAGLPVGLNFDPFEMAEAMSLDKKRKKGGMQLILLEDIGNAVVREVPLNDLKPILDDLR